MTEKTIELVYDDKCPVCRIYCKSLILDDTGTQLALIDARKGGDLIDDITSRRLDIDEGMVLKISSHFYYGSEAMHQIAMLAQKKGWIGWINRLFFSSDRLARVFYPLGKAMRNIALRILGIKRITREE